MRRGSTNPYRWPTTTPAEIEKRNRHIVRLVDHRSLRQVMALARPSGHTLSGAPLLPPLESKDQSNV
jgi:hypothetical protein